MLKTLDLLNGIDEKYYDMLRMVNIPDFTKCVAEFSGLDIVGVSDDVIKRYLHTWAINKYKFFKLLKNKTFLDVDFKYDNKKFCMEDEYLEIGKDFPAYYFWLQFFKNCGSNKVDSGNLSWSAKDSIREVFPNFSINGTTVTHFFKNKLLAPDELVTRIAAIYEDKMIEAKYTISIDPVDMMLASETPYNWDSCYRLEPRSDSHADGCLASVLDNSSLTTYVWNKEGKYNLCDTYEFKKIRYKRFRETIAISPKMNSIHFNYIYPKKDYNDSPIGKELRGIVEKLVAEMLGKENIWTKDHKSECCRKFSYGYSEYCSNFIYRIKDGEDEYWTVFNERIECPSGCGEKLPGLYWDNDCEIDDYAEDEFEYNGCGHIYENYKYRQWCEEAEEYCQYASCCGDCEECYECWAWEQNHPICDITGEDCINIEVKDRLEVYDGVLECNHHCEGCPHYDEWQKEQNTEFID